MSDPTANKALVAEFIDALFTRGELEAVDRYLAPGFVNHDPFPGFAPDREGLRQTAQQLCSQHLTGEITRDEVVCGGGDH